jgi:hypothetical protein
MKFTLYYRGPLKPNGGPKDKHVIREFLHPQIRDLWEHMPLSHMKEKLLDPKRNPDTPPGGNNLLLDCCGHTFACVVSKRLHTTAKLNITILRPEQPGNILAQSGDIDNRLKTLLDALTIPPHANQLPKSFTPSDDQKPFFCLLQDDALVTEISIRTLRWLNPDAISKAEVVLLINVETDTHLKTFENVDF